jgi:carboxymethylenebutenolidase
MRFILLITLLFIAACAPQAVQPIAADPTAPDTHIGCQEDEIDLNGECVPADEKNVELFGQDLDDYVEYTEVTGAAQGFVAMPKEDGRYPGVIMIHEWWGLNDNIKEMAKILAKEGYVVFAVDLYGEVATTSERAGQLAGEVRNDPDRAVERMRNAVKYLREVHDAEEVASLGWCFGGQQSLLLSLNEPMDATVIYYGQLTDDKTQLENLKGPVLGIFGADDTSIPVSSVENFTDSLDALGKTNSIHIYPGVDQGCLGQDCQVPGWESQGIENFNNLIIGY